MKQLISQNGGYKVYAEMKQIDYPEKTKVLQFSTEWDNSKSPETEHVKFTMFLTDDQLSTLKQMI
jgi:hypothetical protein